jgi:hypothetical protein
MLNPAHSSADWPAGPAGRPRAALRWLARTLCVAWLFGSVVAGVAQDSVSREYQIKAAYLYNFAKFVEWPAQSFTNSDAPLVIGIFGQNPFGDELMVIAKDHKINGRNIVIKQVNTVADACGVHMLFFGATEDNHILETLGSLEKKCLLTVGESEKFRASGGIINFVIEDNKVRFEINAATAEHHELKISAQLLKLAKSTHEEPGHTP